MKKQENIILGALRQDHTAWQFVDPELKNNRGFEKSACRAQPLVLEYLNEELKEDEAFAREILKSNGMCL